MAPWSLRRNELSTEPRFAAEIDAPPRVNSLRRHADAPTLQRSHRFSPWSGVFFLCRRVFAKTWAWSSLNSWQEAEKTETRPKLFWKRACEVRRAERRYSFWLWHLTSVLARFCSRLFFIFGPLCLPRATFLSTLQRGFRVLATRRISTKCACTSLTLHICVFDDRLCVCASSVPRARGRRARVHIVHSSR